MTGNGAPGVIKRFRLIGALYFNGDALHLKRVAGWVRDKRQKMKKPAIIH